MAPFGGGEGAFSPVQAAFSPSYSQQVEVMAA